MLDVENLPAELLLLAGWRTKFTTKTVAATVGETSRIGIFNPAQSGLIVVVTDVWLSANAAIAVAYSTSLTALTDDSFSGAPRDSRDGVAVNSGAKVAQQQTGNTVQRGRLIVQIAETYHHTAKNGLAVLGPGTGFEYGTVVDNEVLNATIFWRERAALSSEVNFP
ncbi:MAG: hypothetical protein V3S55_15665 [Nitrospiraceae bacterium]